MIVASIQVGCGVDDGCRSQDCTLLLARRTLLHLLAMCTWRGGRASRTLEQLAQPSGGAHSCATLVPLLPLPMTLAFGANVRCCSGDLATSACAIACIHCHTVYVLRWRQPSVKVGHLSDPS